MFVGGPQCLDSWKVDNLSLSVTFLSCCTSLFGQTIRQSFPRCKYRIYGRTVGWLCAVKGIVLQQTKCVNVPLHCACRQNMSQWYFFLQNFKCNRKFVVACLNCWKVIAITPESSSYVNIKGNIWWKIKCFMANSVVLLLQADK